MTASSALRGAVSREGAEDEKACYVSSGGRTPGRDLRDGRGHACEGGARAGSGEPVGRRFRRRADVGLQFPRHLAVRPWFFDHGLYGNRLQRELELPALCRTTV